MNTTKINTHIKKIVFIGLTLLTVSSVQANEWTGNVSAYLGQKSLDNKDWSNIDKPLSVGVLFDIKKKSWPVSIALDIIASGDVEELGSQKDEVRMSEIHLGARKIFALKNSSFKPYLGGGLALVTAERNNKTAISKLSSKNDAVGVWVGVGTYVSMSEHFMIGLDLRYSKAKVELYNIDHEVGGFNAAITAGYHW